MQTLFLFIWGCQTLTKCHWKIKKNANSVPFNLGLSNVDKMSLQDKEHQYEQSLYWCSLSSSDILSTLDSPKLKGTEFAFFFILQ
jgi:hypothetical protein